MARWTQNWVEYAPRALLEGKRTSQTLEDSTNIHLPLCLSLSEKWRVTECLKTSCMESLQLAGNLLAVRCFRGGYLQKHRNRTKRTMQTQNWPNGRVSSDERTCLRWCVRKEKIFLFLFTATTLLCGALLKKTNKFLGLKKLDNCSF